MLSDFRLSVARLKNTSKLYFCSPRKLILKEFSKTFKALFNYQGSFCFNLLLQQQLIHNIKSLSLCQQLFLFFQVVIFFEKERRKRDLNPRAATNDLLPFQGSPFSHLGISPKCLSKEQTIQFIT